MAKNEHVDTEQQIEEALGKTELFLQKNGKKLLIALVIIALGVGGFFGYGHFYSTPRSQEAANAMYQAQDLFERDSFAVALTGVDGVLLGFDAIITDYSGTPEANVANHYAGICKMKMGEYQEAINYFEAYKQASGAAGEVVYAQNVGLIGDCYIELGDNAKGVDYYRQAIKASSGDATAPVYTHKAAIALYTQGDYQGALELFESLKTDYPRAMQTRDADKFITLVKQKI